MVNEKSFGRAVTPDYALDNGFMVDDDAVVIFRSVEATHAMMLNIWHKGDEVVHTYVYAIEEEGSTETIQNAFDPGDLVEELPERYQAEARDALERWLEAVDTSVLEPRS